MPITPPGVAQHIMHRELVEETQAMLQTPDHGVQDLINLHGKLLERHVKLANSFRLPRSIAEVHLFDDSLMALIACDRELEQAETST